MINEDIWQLLENLYEQFPDLKCSNATDAQICLAEENLNLKFSDFYRYFLKNHEVSSISGVDINTLNKPKTDSSYTSVVEATIKFNQSKRYPGNDNYYIISNNYNGEILGANPRGEICILSHDTDKKVKVAENFEEFLSKLLV
jgi:cell wall assembly regulator SMI1